MNAEPEQQGSFIQVDVPLASVLHPSRGKEGRENTRRPGFFEIQADEEVFYVHVSTVAQKITLLATWSREPELEVVHSK